MLPVLLSLAAFGVGTSKAVATPQLGMPIDEKKAPGILNDWRSVGAAALGVVSVLAGGKNAALAGATAMGLGLSYAGTEITRKEGQKLQAQNAGAPPLMAPVPNHFRGDAYGCAPTPLQQFPAAPYTMPQYAGQELGAAPLGAPFGL